MVSVSDSKSSRLEAGVQVGDFRIEERIGAGGMGIVYRARQVSLNRIVALKILGNALTTSSDIVRFQREAQAAARLKHPNIASVYFVGQDEELCYMAIEYIDGPSLGRIVRCLATTRDPKLNLDSVLESIEQAEPRAPTIRFDEQTETLGSEDSVGCREYDLKKISEDAQRLAQSANHIRRSCELVRDVARALAHAHEKSVVHRDIKPDNLLVDKDGQVHIIDFGIARFFQNATVTQTGRLVGTPMYMSPEQVTARLDVDHRTDIYSLGLALYELLILRPAMLAPTREGVLRNIVTKALPPVSSKNPGVSQDLEGVLHKATARDPDERYQTADELAGDLQHCLDGKPVAAKPYRYQADLGEIEATRPRSVLALSIALQAVALPLALVGIIFLFNPLPDSLLFGTGLLSIGSAMFILGWGLVSGYSWARRLAIELAIVIGGLAVWGLIVELCVAENAEFSYQGLLFWFLLISLSVALPVVTSRRKTRDWLVRARGVRAECMRGNKILLGAIGAVLAGLGPVAFVVDAMQPETEYMDFMIEKYLEEEKYVNAETESRVQLIYRKREVLKGELSEGHWKIGNMMTLLGASLSGQDKFEEAEPLFLDGYSQMKDDAEVPEERIREALQRIIELYEAWGKPDKAGEYRAILAHGSDAGEATHP